MFIILPISENSYLSWFNAEIVEKIHPLLDESLLSIHTHSFGDADQVDVKWFQSITFMSQKMHSSSLHKIGKFLPPIGITPVFVFEIDADVEWILGDGVDDGFCFRVLVFRSGKAFNNSCPVVRRDPHGGLSCGRGGKIDRIDRRLDFTTGNWRIVVVGRIVFGSRSVWFGAIVRLGRYFLVDITRADEIILAVVRNRLAN